ncbi:MAG: hypothetical protein ACKOXB_04255 [Flavobacteriales bacterium]
MNSQLSGEWNVDDVDGIAFSKGSVVYKFTPTDDTHGNYTLTDAGPPVKTETGMYALTNESKITLTSSTNKVVELIVVTRSNTYMSLQTMGGAIEDISKK